MSHDNQLKFIMMMNEMKDKQISDIEEQVNKTN